MHVLILFDLAEAEVRRIRETMPAVHVHQLERTDAAYGALLPRAEVLFGWPAPEDLPRAQRLRWVQLPSAGVGRYPERLPAGVLLTNSSGLFGIPVAEHVFALMLGLARAVPQAVRAAAEATWDPSPAFGELHGTTCGLLGLGDIGQAVARRAKAFGMRVLAVRRHVEETPAYVDALWPVAELDRLLAASDHVVNTLPHTEATHHLIDAGRIARMKPGAFFYNVGRGGTVDEAALVEALQEGRLAGAGLDVFETEPLPAESPLWHLPNVILTPHQGGATPHLDRRQADLFLRNLQGFLRDEPLENVVDRARGY